MNTRSYFVVLSSLYLRMCLFSRSCFLQRNLSWTDAWTCVYRSPDRVLRVLSRVLGTISTTLTTFDSRRQEDALVVSMLWSHKLARWHQTSSLSVAARLALIQEFFATLDAGEEVNPQAWINDVRVFDQTCSIYWTISPRPKVQRVATLGAVQENGSPHVVPCRLIFTKAAGNSNKSNFWATSGSSTRPFNNDLPLPSQKCEHDVPVSFCMIVFSFLSSHCPMMPSASENFGNLCNSQVSHNLCDSWICSYCSCRALHGGKSDGICLEIRGCAQSRGASAASLLRYGPLHSHSGELCTMAKTLRWCLQT